MSFHDDKLWQQAYVAVLDILEATDALDQADIVSEVRRYAMMVLTVTSDAVSRRDRRERDAKLRDAYFRTVALRSLLSVLWAKEILSDDAFGKLDSALEGLSAALPA